MCVFIQDLAESTKYLNWSVVSFVVGKPLLVNWGDLCKFPQCWKFAAPKLLFMSDVIDTLWQEQLLSTSEH